METMANQAAARQDAGETDTVANRGPAHHSGAYLANTSDLKRCQREPVFAVLRVKRTAPPAGIVTVVKWKTPSGGSVSVTLLVGAKGPSAPVLPLLNVCARAADGPSSSRPTTTLSGVLTPRIVRLLDPVLTARGSLHIRLTAP